MSLQRVSTYIRHIPQLWFGQRIKGLHSFSRTAAGQQNIKLNTLLPLNHSHALLELNCQGLNARAVRQLLRRTIRLGQIASSRVNASRVFSEQNIIHQMLSIEAEMFKSEEITIAYHKLNSILLRVKRQLKGSMTPAQKLKLVYTVMQQQGLSLVANEEDLLVSHLLRNTADCDASSLIVFAVSQELGWPVKLVLVPKHVFVRYEADGHSINIDYGIIKTDQYYVEKYHWNKTCLDLNGIIALIFDNRGLANHKLKRYEKAILDYDQAIELNPLDAEIFDNRGCAKDALRRYEEAILDCDQAIKLNPLYANAFNNRGYAKDALRRYEEAILDYDQAIKLNPLYANAFNNRGLANHKLKRYEKAILDYDQAIELNPLDATAFNNMGIVLNHLGQLGEARQAFEQAERLRQGS